MSLSEDFLVLDDLHPIDIVETLAEHHAWEFDRVTDDQIAMAVEGQWRTYSLTLAWSAQAEVPALAVEADREPVRFVANPLEELEPRRVLGQHHGFGAAREEHLLDTFRERDHRGGIGERER